MDKKHSSGADNSRREETAATRLDDRLSYHVGVFDSGVGGLTVAKAITNMLPGVRLTYFADSIHLPYGNKSSENIIAYSIENAKFLKDKGAQFLVIACNTASAVALPELKKSGVGLPLMGVIEPGVRAALAMTETKKIGVIGTLRTINSNAYKDTLLSLAQGLTVYQKACPLLVPIIEEGSIKQEILKLVLREYLAEFIYEVDVLILGCTHYPLISGVIGEMYPHLKIVDSAMAIASELVKKTAGHVRLDCENKDELTYNNNAVHVEEHKIKHGTDVAYGEKNTQTNTHVNMQQHPLSEVISTDKHVLTTLSINEHKVSLEADNMGRSAEKVGALSQENKYKNLETQSPGNNAYQGEVMLYTNDVNETLLKLAQQFFATPNITLV
ncbi:glutamate racemase [Spirochaetota bacterium]|nr:glutamate racemase [Spirochaetota bacterium]